MADLKLYEITDGFMKLLDEKEVMDAPESVSRHLVDANMKDQNYKFTVGVSLPDCTGCGLCINNCPGKLIDFTGSRI